MNRPLIPGEYTVTEVPPEGWKVIPPELELGVQVDVPVGGTCPDSCAEVDIMNDYDPGALVVQKVVDLGGVLNPQAITETFTVKVRGGPDSSLPEGQEAVITFELRSDGSIWASVNGGPQVDTDSVCLEGLIEGEYWVWEEEAGPEWTEDPLWPGYDTVLVAPGVTCEDVGLVPVVMVSNIYCPGSVVVHKTTEGCAGNNPTDFPWTFTLSGPGGYSETKTADNITGTVEFGPLAVGVGDYTLCELEVPVGWSANWTMDGVPVYPDINPTTGDYCLTFTVPACDTVTFDVDNVPPPGICPRTPGYWKNWSCYDDSGNQCEKGGDVQDPENTKWLLEEAIGATAEGFIMIGDLQLYPEDGLQAIAILEMRDLSSTKKNNNMANDAAYKLARNLLAAKLNVAAGAVTCSALFHAIEDGQALLKDIDFVGTGSYLGPKSRDPLRTDALELAGILDAYNNGMLEGCECSDYDDEEPNGTVSTATIAAAATGGLLGVIGGFSLLRRRQRIVAASTGRNCPTCGYPAAQSQKWGNYSTEGRLQCRVCHSDLD